MIFCNNCIVRIKTVKINPFNGRRNRQMRYVVTCFLEKEEPCSFIVYGGSKHEAAFTFEKTLKEASPLNDYVELSDGKQVKVGSILAYRIDDIPPLF